MVVLDSYFKILGLAIFCLPVRFTLQLSVYMIKFKVKVMLAMREMTQKELAEKTGIRPPTVSAICTGTVKHLPIDALDKICAVLNCQPSDLMEYIED